MEKLKKAIKVCGSFNAPAGAFKFEKIILIDEFIDIDKNLTREGEIDNTLSIKMCLEQFNEDLPYIGYSFYPDDNLYTQEFNFIFHKYAGEYETKKELIEQMNYFRCKGYEILAYIYTNKETKKSQSNDCYRRVIELANEGICQKDICTKLELNKSVFSRYFKRGVEENHIKIPD